MNRKICVFLVLSIMFCFNIPATGFAQDVESKNVESKEPELKDAEAKAASAKEATLNPSANRLAEKYIETMNKRSCDAKAKKDYSRAARDYKMIFTLVEKRQALTAEEEKKKLTQHIEAIEKAHFADIKCQKISKKKWRALMSVVESRRYKQQRVAILSSKAKTAEQKSQRNHKLKVEKARHKQAMKKLSGMAIYTDWPDVKYLYQPYFTGGKRGPKLKKRKGKPNRCTKGKCIE